jgi:hypothetical protein
MENEKELLLEWTLYQRCVVAPAERENKRQEFLDWALCIGVDVIV